MTRDCCVCVCTEGVVGRANEILRGKVRERGAVTRDPVTFLDGGHATTAIDIMEKEGEKKTKKNYANAFIFLPLQRLLLLLAFALAATVEEFYGRAWCVYGSKCRLGQMPARICT